VLLEGKTSLITASSTGIGKAIAHRFALEGSQVVITSRDEEKGEAAEEEIRKKGGKCIFIAADATKEASVAALVSKVRELYGKIDILVNNVGGVVEGTVATHTLDEWNYVFELNVTSAYLLSHNVLPVMITNGGGVVLNISSEVALKGFKGRAAYSASKAALIGMTRSMAVDFADDGIRVNVLCPGTVETPAIKALIEQKGPQKREKFIKRRLVNYLATPDDIANAALFLCSPQSSYCTGSILTCDGGATIK